MTEVVVGVEPPILCLHHQFHYHKPHKMRSNSKHTEILQTLSWLHSRCSGSSAVLILREVFRGFSEEARTRCFPSPPLGGFRFVTHVN